MFYNYNQHKLLQLESEIVSLKKELLNKESEQKKKNTIFNSISIPLFVALIPLFGIAISSIFQQHNDNILAQRKFIADSSLQNQKLKSDLILKAFDQKDTIGIANMLSFELNAHLIDDPNGYLQKVIEHSSILMPLIGFNVQPEDPPTVMVTNITKDGGCETGPASGCWKTSIDASPGDVIGVQIFFHNSFLYLARNTTIALLPKVSSKDTSHLFVGSVASKSIPRSEGYAIVRMKTPASITFIPGTLRIFEYGQKVGYSSLKEDSLFTPTGFLIGDVEPGWDAQGAIVARFKVSDN